LWIYHREKIPLSGITLLEAYRERGEDMNGILNHPVILKFARDRDLLITTNNDYFVKVVKETQTFVEISIPNIVLLRGSQSLEDHLNASLTIGEYYNVDYCPVLDFANALCGSLFVSMVIFSYLRLFVNI
jgi:hypothetical protein